MAQSRDLWQRVDKRAGSGVLWWLRGLLAAAVLSAACGGAAGQDQAVPTQPASEETAPATDAPPTLAEIDEQIAALDTRTDLDEAVRSQISTELQHAKSNVQSAAQRRSRVTQFRERAASAPGIIAELKAQLEKPAPAVTNADVPDVELAALQLDLTDTMAASAAATLRRDEIVAQIAAAPSRLNELPNLIAAARNRVSELEGAEPFPSDVSAMLATALGFQHRAELNEARSQVEELVAERDMLNAENAKLPEQRAIVEREIAAAEARLEVLRSRIAQKQQEETARAQREAAALQKQIEERALQVPAIAEAAKNARVVVEATAEIQTETARVSAKDDGFDAALVKLKAMYAAASERLDRAGRTRAAAVFLHRDLHELERSDYGIRYSSRHLKRLAEVEFEWLKHEDMLAERLDVQRTLQAALEGLSDKERAEIEEIGLESFSRERDAIGAHVQALSELSAKMNEAFEAATALGTAADQYRAFLEERALWLPSLSGKLVPERSAIADAVRLIIVTPEWPASLMKSVRAEFDNSIRTITEIALVVLLFTGAPWIKRKLRRTGVLAMEEGCDRFRYTSWAILYSGLLALPKPLTLIIFARFLERPDDQNFVVISASNSLMSIASALIMLEFVRATAMRGGLGEAHFGWPEDGMRQLRGVLRWFVPTVVVVALVASTLFESGQAVESEGLGRICFVFLQLQLALAGHQLLKPGRPLNIHMRGGIDGPPWRRKAWRTLYSIAVALPLGLVVLTLFGYLFTAQRIGASTFDSTMVVFVVAFIYSVLMRWLYFARLRFARKIAAEDAEARRDAAERDGEAPPEEEFAIQQVDLPEISAQSRQLIRATLVVISAVLLYGIWSSLLPALGAAQRVEIFPRPRIVEATNTMEVWALTGDQKAGPQSVVPTRDGNGAAPMPSDPTKAMINTATGETGGATAGGEDTGAAPLRVTLADFGEMVFLLVITIVLAKNLPGLLEIAILKRLPFDKGSQYAIVTIVSYVILIFGSAMSLAALGLSWEKVQFLAAALTFGLAFGLQEIFANFVSGLLILLERPIRVGDTVTVGDISGNVARIRMRATTIVDWDRKELIIPNKRMITEPLVNWTLTDPTLRAVLPVVVAFGTDPEKVMTILEQVARESETVLDDPAPKAFFLGYGDKGLNIDVRVYIPSLGSVLGVKTELYNAIDAALKAEGIRLATPRRDVRIAPAGRGLDQVIDESEQSRDESD